MRPGWLLIGIITIIPTILLLTLGPALPTTLTFADLTHKLAEICALTGIALFALTFVLSTRWRIFEGMFGGLDKVFRVHAIVGASAFILVMFHPLLLVLRYIPTNFQQAALYLMPGSYWSVNFGIIALFGLALLLSLTLYFRMKYNDWKFSHEFLGLAFMFAAAHALLVPRDAARDYIFTGYSAFAWTVSIIGLAAFTYSLILRSRITRLPYEVKKINVYKDAYELVLTPLKRPLTYHGGQFVFVSFKNNILGREAHPFSIASAGTKDIRIIAKSLGDYTKRISQVKVGDKAVLEGPYGRFYDHIHEEEIWVAGGIGITPFLGMAPAIEDNEKVTLFYSVKDPDEFVGLDELQALSKIKKGFQLIPWISNRDGYLTTDAIKKVTKGVEGKAFRVCGPPTLKQAIKKALLSDGVHPDMIYEEAFDFR